MPEQPVSFGRTAVSPVVMAEFQVLRDVLRLPAGYRQ